MKWATMILAAALAATAWAAETQNAESLPAVAGGTQNPTATTENETQGAPPTEGKPENAEAQQKARQEAVRQALERARTRQRLEARAGEALEFDATPLAQALEMLGQAGGFSVVFDRETLQAAGVDPETHSVTARLGGMAYEDALGLILPQTCGYQVGAGYIVVTTLEQSWLPLRTMVFGVRELLAEVPDFGGQAPRFEMGDVTGQAAGGTVGDLFTAGKEEGGEDESRATPEQILDLVKRHVRSAGDRRIAPWSDDGGPATIEYLDGKLIVSQTYEGLVAVAKLLAAIQ